MQDSIPYYYPYSFRDKPDWMETTVESRLDSTHIAVQKSAYDIEGNHAGKDLPFYMEGVDSIFLLLLFCFLFFAQVYNGGIGFLKSNYRLIFSTNVNLRVSQQSTVKENLFSYFLIFQAVLFIAISLFDTLQEYGTIEKTTQTPFTTILLMVLLMVGYLILKTIIYRVVGFIFDTSSEMRTWESTYFAILEMLGIIYFFPTLLLVYSDYLQTTIVIFVLILLIAMHLVLFYKLIAFFITEKFNFLYLITYLCTVEILPIIFLAIGLVYIYRLDIDNLLWLLK